SAIKPNCGTRLSSLLYWNVTGLSARMASLALSIGLISFLNRREDGIGGCVPSWPSLFIVTTLSVPPSLTPLMPAIKVRVWWIEPIRVVFDSLAAPPVLPMSILKLPVPMMFPAEAPKAILSAPVVLKAREPRPIAVLALPVVLRKSALRPVAVFSMPEVPEIVVLQLSGPAPTAVLPKPLMLLTSAIEPVAVLELPVVLLTSA